MCDVSNNNHTIALNLKPRKLHFCKIYKRLQSQILNNKEHNTIISNLNYYYFVFALKIFLNFNVKQSMI
jgi:hypothetical protein